MSYKLEQTLILPSIIDENYRYVHKPLTCDESSHIEGTKCSESCIFDQIIGRKTLILPSIIDENYSYVHKPLTCDESSHIEGTKCSESCIFDQIIGYN
jgi:hypothetical protein